MNNCRFLDLVERCGKNGPGVGERMRLQPVKRTEYLSDCRQENGIQ